MAKNYADTSPTLTAKDIDYIARVVETEVGSWNYAKSRGLNKAQYAQMARGVVDTITNRIGSPSYPGTVEKVVDGYKQFSKINAPATKTNPHPYGSVRNAPKASELVQNIVEKHVAARAAGMPSTVGANTHYLNISASDQAGKKWSTTFTDRINLGIPSYGHTHGTAKGAVQPGYMNINAGAIFNPSNMDKLGIGYSVTPRATSQPLPGRMSDEYSAINAAPVTPVISAPLPDIMSAPGALSDLLGVAAMVDGGAQLEGAYTGEFPASESMRNLEASLSMDMSGTGPAYPETPRSFPSPVGFDQYEAGRNLSRSMPEIMSVPGGLLDGRLERAAGSMPGAAPAAPPTISRNPFDVQRGTPGPFANQGVDSRSLGGLVTSAIRDLPTLEALQDAGIKPGGGRFGLANEFGRANIPFSPPDNAPQSKNVIMAQPGDRFLDDGRKMPDYSDLGKSLFPGAFSALDAVQARNNSLRDPMTRQGGFQQASSIMGKALGAPQSFTRPESMYGDYAVPFDNSRAAPNSPEKARENAIRNAVFDNLVRSAAAAPAGQNLGLSAAIGGAGRPNPPVSAPAARTTVATPPDRPVGALPAARAVTPSVAALADQYAAYGAGASTTNRAPNDQRAAGYRSLAPAPTYAARQDRIDIPGSIVAPTAATAATVGNDERGSQRATVAGYVAPAPAPAPAATRSVALPPLEAPRTVAARQVAPPPPTVPAQPAMTPERAKALGMVETIPGAFMPDVKANPAQVMRDQMGLIAANPVASISKMIAGTLLGGVFHPGVGNMLGSVRHALGNFDGGGVSTGGLRSFSTPAGNVLGRSEMSNGNFQVANQYGARTTMAPDGTPIGVSYGGGGGSTGK